VLVREFPIKKQRGKLVFPQHEQFETAPRMATQVVDGWACPIFIKCPKPQCNVDWVPFLTTIDGWFTDVECEEDRYRLFGVFGCEVHPYRVDREFHGVTIYFLDYCDAVHLKLSLADHCEF
jgi:hypothetical protein